jgi:hypothetical protein
LTIVAGILAGNNPAFVGLPLFSSLREGKTGLANRSMNSLGLLRGVRADDSAFPIEVSIFSAAIGDAGVITAIVRNVSERQHPEQAARARYSDLKWRVAQRTAELTATI